MPCDPVIEEEVNHWTERNDRSPERVIPQSGSQLEESSLPKSSTNAELFEELDEFLVTSMVGMESMRMSQTGISNVEIEDAREVFVNLAIAPETQSIVIEEMVSDVATEETGESFFNFAPETQSTVFESIPVSQSGISDVAMEEAGVTVVNVASENQSMDMDLNDLESKTPAVLPTEHTEGQTIIYLPFVQIHSGGLQLIDMPSSSPLDLTTIRPIQGSNEVMINQMETVETSVLNVIVPPVDPQKSFVEEGEVSNS